MSISSDEPAFIPETPLDCLDPKTIFIPETQIETVHTKGVENTSKSKCSKSTTKTQHSINSKYANLSNKPKSESKKKPKDISMHIETMKLKAKLQQHLNNKQITTSTIKNKGTEFKAHTHKKDIVLIPQPVSQSQSLDKIYESTTPEEISHSLTPVTPLLTKYIYSKGNGFLIPTTTSVSHPHQDEIESSDNETQSTPMLKTKRKKRRTFYL